MPLKKTKILDLKDHTIDDINSPGFSLEEFKY